MAKNVKKPMMEFNKLAVLAVFLIGLVVVLLLVNSPSFRKSSAANERPTDVQNGIGMYIAREDNSVTFWNLDESKQGKNMTFLWDYYQQKGSTGVDKTETMFVPYGGSFHMDGISSCGQYDAFFADNPERGRGHSDDNCPPPPTTTPVSCRNLIDFSSVPGQAAPTDNQILSNQYAARYGVTFSMKKPAVVVPADVCQPKNGPRIAKEGAPWTAFQGIVKNGNNFDNLASGQKGGPWFLTDNGIISPTVSSNAKYGCTIRVDYQAGFRGKGVQFDLLDQDGNESYIVNAYNAAGTKVSFSYVAPKNSNGISAPIAVSSANTISSPATDEIAAIEIVPQGKRPDGAGWGMAIDNLCVNDGVVLPLP